MRAFKIATSGLLLACAFLWTGAVAAQTEPPTGGLLDAIQDVSPETTTGWVRAFLAITVFSVAPSVLLLTTSFPRIFVILSFLRRAIGAQDLPSGQVVAGLSLILTCLTMLPVWSRVYSDAYAPYSRGELTDVREALTRAAAPVRAFMQERTRAEDLALFEELTLEARGLPETSHAPVGPATRTQEDASHDFLVVLPAFILGELRLAFEVGILLCLPFLVIDMVVSAVLLSLGMFLVPPLLVSLPIKILVFVLADGWGLVVEQVVRGVLQTP